VWRSVVGVVAEVHHQALDKEVRSEMYLPNAQFPTTTPDSVPGAQNALTLVIRTKGDPVALTTAARGVIRTVDAQLPVAQIRTLDDVVSQSVSTPRLATFLLGIFGALALMLSAIGVYGVMSYGVAQRTNEIGIRMALGARASDVARLVVRQGMRPAIVGLVLGVVAALSGAKLMRGLLFGVRENDPMSLIIAVALARRVAPATILPAHTPVPRVIRCRRCEAISAPEEELYRLPGRGDAIFCARGQKFAGSFSDPELPCALVMVAEPCFRRRASSCRDGPPRPRPILGSALLIASAILLHDRSCPESSGED
jgi:hypothetical protein